MCVCVYVCVYFALVILRENRILSAPNCIAMCGLSDPITFSTLSHKWHDFFKKKFFKDANCVLIFSATSVWNISHSKNNSAVYDNKGTQGFI